MKSPMVHYYDEVLPENDSGEFLPGEKENLDRINQQVGAGLSLEEIIDFLFSQSAGDSKTDRLSLAFLEEEGMRVFSRVVRTQYEPILLKSGYSEDLRNGSLMQVITRGCPRIIMNLADYAAVNPESRSSRLLVDEGVRSSMTCPLRVQNRTVGLLFRNSRKPHAYGRHEVMLHQATAERLSQTVEKAYRIQELEAANRNYTEMLAFVGHELKGPLSSIITAVDLMLQGYLGEVEARQREKLSVITEKASYLLGMVEDYLNLGRIENAELRATISGGVDFKTRILKTALSVIADQAEEKQIRVETEVQENLSPVSCDADLMRIAMTNLLSNGIKYGNPGGRLRIQAYEDEKRFHVRVYNTGPGFPAPQKSRLFRKFSRLESPELMKRKGTGVGLYTVWRIIKLHGGTVDAQSVEGEWAEFSFTIPLAVQSLP